jgi:Kdo2-lipid IVA lauroyltransferase/acyltransferase
MRRFKKARYALELAASRLALLVIPRLSRHAAVAFSRWLGTAAYRMSHHLRQLGEANLDIAFGDSLSADQRREILLQSFRTFAQVVVDIFWFARHTRERVLHYVRFDREAHGFNEKRPRICVTAHFGSWELLGHVASLHGYPLASVAAPLSNRALDRLFTEVRQSSGQIVLPRQGAVKGLLATLRDGGNLGLLLDQNTKLSEGGLFVDFFGLPVPISGVAASLALRTGAEIVFGFSLPRPDGTYDVHVPHRFTPHQQPGEDFKTASARITQEIAHVIEGEIRKQPGTWLWMYKRWKYVAPGVPRERYPFYAKALPDAATHPPSVKSASPPG